MFVVFSGSRKDSNVPSSTYPENTNVRVVRVHCS